MRELSGLRPYFLLASNSASKLLKASRMFIRRAWSRFRKKGPPYSAQPLTDVPEEASTSASSSSTADQARSSILRSLSSAAEERIQLRRDKTERKYSWSFRKLKASKEPQVNSPDTESSTSPASKCSYDNITMLMEGPKGLMAEVVDDYTSLAEEDINWSAGYVKLYCMQDSRVLETGDLSSAEDVRADVTADGSKAVNIENHGGLVTDVVEPDQCSSCRSSQPSRLSTVPMCVEEEGLSDNLSSYYLIRPTQGNETFASAATRKLSALCMYEGEVAVQQFGSASSADTMVTETTPGKGTWPTGVAETFPAVFPTDQQIGRDTDAFPEEASAGAADACSFTSLRDHQSRSWEDTVGLAGKPRKDGLQNVGELAECIFASETAESPSGQSLKLVCTAEVVEQHFGGENMMDVFSLSEDDTEDCGDVGCYEPTSLEISLASQDSPAGCRFMPSLLDGSGDSTVRIDLVINI